MVKHALKRAKIDAPAKGAHLLRHTAATEIFRDGVPLDQAGLVLRHRSIDMTAYYAKADVALLKQVAQPWPEMKKGLRMLAVKNSAKRSAALTFWRNSVGVDPESTPSRRGRLIVRASVMPEPPISAKKSTMSKAVNEAETSNLLDPINRGGSLGDAISSTSH